MRVIAVATPAFALPILDALGEAADVELAGLITNPDRPRGRGLEPGPPAAKEWALARGVPVCQPEKLSREALAAFAAFEPAADALVVVASAFYVPAWLRAVPRLGAINLHPSLLPELRGPAPINWAIIEGYGQTGVTTLRLVDEIDAGDILLQERVNIYPGETAGSLAEKLARLGARVVLETLRGLERGEIRPTPQDPADASVLYRPKITADIRAVDWTRTADELERLVRGLYPDAPARASLRGNVFQILAAEPAQGEGDAAPGTITALGEAGVVVACGEGALRLTRVKPAGRGEMTAHAFALGRRLAVGDRFD